MRIQPSRPRITSARVALMLAVSSALIAIPTTSATTAAAASYSLTVNGPTSNVMGANFTETISGDASGPANYVAAWEQFYQHSGCAPTFAQESVRAFARRTWGLTPWLGSAVSAGHYSLPARFGARNPGTHGMCAYLIDATTGTTYAYGSIWWNNHN